MDYKDKKILILGLGVFSGGVETAKYFASQKAKVTVLDLKSKGQLRRSIEQLNNYPISYVLGTNDINDLEEYDVLVVSPAIPPSHPLIVNARQIGLPVTTEVNLFFERCHARIIGVVGTNGKGTVIKLLSEIFSWAGRKFFVGGNIGSSLLNQPASYRQDVTVLFELSSFQLARLRTIKRRPDLLLLLNIQPDHLDWHGDFNQYVSDKLVALEGQGKKTLSIINVDDQVLKENLAKVEGRLIKVSLTDFSHADAFVVEDRITVKSGGREIELAKVNRQLPGKHNVLNQTLAATAAFAEKIEPKIINSAIAKFTGTAHSLELVNRVKNISFYDDSEATNPQATIAALDSFSEPINLIIGGFDKKIDYTPLLRAISPKKVKEVAIIGQLTDQFYSRLSSDKSLSVFSAYRLEGAFDYLVKKAQSGEIVLLSPGTSSYDQFENLEERGDKFKSLVKQFKGEYESG